MFCEECGAKNKKGATFCEECGHAIKAEETKKAEPKKEKVETKKEVTEKVAKKPMSKGTKLLIGGIVAVVAILVGAYVYLSSVFTPEKVAIKYFKAYASKDANKICKVIKLDESEFVSKKLLKEALKDEEKIDLENYKIEKNPTKSQLEKALGIKETDDLSKSITIKYIKKGSSKEYYKTIKLVKSKNKKFLFFDNWVVDSSDLVANDYSISVPKGAKPTIDGIEIKDKYKTSNTYTDTYKIPSILKGTHKITAKLKSGIVLTGEYKVNGNYGSISSSSLKLDKKTEETIKKSVKDNLTTIYDAVIADKSFEDIEEKFNEDYRDDIRDKYANLKQSALSDYNKLKEIKINDVNITYYSISNDELSVTARIKYDYKVEYKNGDEKKEYSKKDRSDNVYLTYKIGKSEFVLSNIRSIVSYFSHYSY